MSKYKNKKEKIRSILSNSLRKDGGNIEFVNVLN